MYRDYSRLDLTYAADRPIAIDGLQERILAALDVRGGFGVFDEERPESDGHSPGRGLLRRSLLWCRGADTPALYPIGFPADHATGKVPSWSWMAYAGGIDYIGPRFGRVEWNALGSPWSPSSRPGDTALVAEARDYAYEEEGPVGKRCEVVFDDPTRASPAATTCIVLGTDRPEMGSARTHYVLVVERTKRQDREGNDTYKRIGAGYLADECVARNGTQVKVY